MGQQISVVINGRQKQIDKDVLPYRDVVALAYDSPAFSDQIVYTITYKRGHGSKPEGTLVDGETLRLKDGMIINVGRTDKS